MFILIHILRLHFNLCLSYGSTICTDLPPTCVKRFVQILLEWAFNHNFLANVSEGVGNGACWSVTPEHVAHVLPGHSIPGNICKVSVIHTYSWGHCVLLDKSVAGKIIRNTAHWYLHWYFNYVLKILCNNINKNCNNVINDQIFQFVFFFNTEWHSKKKQSLTKKC